MKIDVTERQKKMITSGAFYTLNMGSAIIGIIETGISAINGKTKLMYYYGMVSAYNLLIAAHHKKRYQALQSVHDCTIARFEDKTLYDEDYETDD